MSILEVKNIKKKFDNEEILKGISFDMEEGQVVSIIGSSGSGKTTLLRCINFLETPDSGTISVRGQELFNADTASGSRRMREEEIRQKRLHFGMVFQQFNLFPQYTAFENVALAPVLLGLKDRVSAEKEAVDLLCKMGLSDRVTNYPHQLSGGQQQRVAIARALAMHPDILCFDEPTSALDPELTGEVLKVIRSLAEAHTTMIIVTHEMNFARDVSDQIIFMDQGVIMEKGDARQVIDNPKKDRTRQFLSAMGNYK